MSKSPSQIQSVPHGALLSCLTLLICACLTIRPSHAQNRVALVIGNSAYQHTSTLANPENDARLIAEKLRATGFEVLEYTNLGHQEMRRAFATYTTSLQKYGREGVGLIFYAGHGVQVNGQNYIMPVDANITKEADIEVEALNASILMRSITLVNNKLNIIILDACRNNPYRSAFRSASRGLARMDAPIGSLVAFSTAPGMVAADGSGSNSPYTESLARAITAPGLKIEDMFKRVRNDVYKDTRGSQVPWESSSIFGDFYFAEQTKPAVTINTSPTKKPNTAQTQNQAGQVWTTIQSTTSAAVLQSFISQFPSSVYAGFAKAKLNELRSKTANLSPRSEQPKPALQNRQPPPRDNKMRAVLVSGSKPLTSGVRWDIYEAKTDADGKRRHITYNTTSIPKLKLKDGRYFITATFGNAQTSGEIVVRPDKPWGRQFVLNAGRLILTTSLAKETPPLKSNVRWDIYHAELDEDDKRRHITYVTSWRAKFALSAGRYYITARHDNASIGREITVAPGKVQKLPFILNAGRLTLTSSLTKDGPPLKSNVRWDIYHAELDEDDKRRHITYNTSWRAKFALPAGRYYFTARHNNASIAREITVVAGKLQKIPFDLNAGRLILTTALTGASPPLKSNVRYDVYRAEKDEDGKHKHITYATSWRAKLALPAGRYLISARHSASTRDEMITVEPGQTLQKVFGLNASRIKFIGRAKNGTPLTRSVRWDIYSAKANFEGKHKHITYATSAQPILTVTAGSYLVVLTHGKSNITQNLTVTPGETKQVDVRLK